MPWELRYRLGLLLHTSLVVAALVALVAAILCSWLARHLDHLLNLGLFNYSSEGARAVLGTLAGSMLTFIVFILSATLIVVQLASGQLTPRVIALVLTKRGVRIALGIFTFTYAFTLSTLARIDQHVPDLPVAISMIMNFLSLLIFFYFVQQFSTGLRPSSLMLLVGTRARRAIEQVYPRKFDPKQPEAEPRDAIPNLPARVVEYSGDSGVVMAFGAGDLIRLAESSGAVVELIPQVGDLLAQGSPLFRVYRESSPIPDLLLRRCVALGPERTLEQDPRFAFRILVDIANKALSPAINDPTTSVLALDQIDHLLMCLGRRRLDEGLGCGANGDVKLIYPTPDWPDFVLLAITEIRLYGEGSIQVNRRLRAMLDGLLKGLPKDRHAPLEQELALLTKATERHFPDEIDRQRACIADHQGVGGSET